MKRPELNLKRKDTATRRALERKVSDPVPNPLDTVDYSAGDPEASSQEEASALLDGFRQRAEREAARRQTPAPVGERGRLGKIRRG
jgi:hypothetical protein